MALTLWNDHWSLDSFPLPTKLFRKNLIWLAMASTKWMSTSVSMAVTSEKQKIGTQSPLWFEAKLREWVFDFNFLILVSASSTTKNCILSDLVCSVVYVLIHMSKKGFKKRRRNPFQQAQVFKSYTRSWICFAHLTLIIFFLPHLMKPINTHICFKHKNGN